MFARRHFLFGTVAAAASLGGEIGFGQVPTDPTRGLGRSGSPRVRISLNAYSFNRQLSSGRMTIWELLEFCVRQGFDAVDLTGYYLTGYPATPPASELMRFKREAFVAGLEISGTGVRNDFTVEEATQAASEIELVKRWIQVAAHLGAPNLRIFTGKPLAAGEERGAITSRVVKAIRACLVEAESAGVMLAIQNHADFVATPADLFAVLRGVGSEWLAVNLDIGSFRSADPYREIAEVAPWAVAWQIKEEVYFGDHATPTDLKKIAAILKESRYRGYVLLETLGEGDPRQSVPRFLGRLRDALAG